MIEAPTAWQAARIGELLIKADEFIEPQPDKVYKQVTIRLWGKGVILRDEVKGAEIKAAKRSVVRAGQFILSRIDARHGAFGLIPNFLDGALVSNDFPAFNVNEERLLPEYLEWMSKTRSFVDMCIAASEGTTNRVRLKENLFLNLQIPLPPLPEQRRIVAKIQQLVEKVEEARGLREEVERYTNSAVMSLHHQITEGADYLPMEEVAPLVRRPVTVELDKSYPELGVRSFGKGTFHKPALTGVEVGKKRLYEISEDDLVFNIVFAWEGAVAVAQHQDNGRVGSHRFLTCVPKEELATSNYLYYYFQSLEGIDKLGQASPGGAGRNRTLSMKGLAGIEVPVPLYEKQVYFDNFCKRFRALEPLVSPQTVELNALLPSILDKAFKGEL